MFFLSYEFKPSKRGEMLYGLTFILRHKMQCTPFSLLEVRKNFVACLLSGNNVSVIHRDITSMSHMGPSSSLYRLVARVLD